MNVEERAALEKQLGLFWEARDFDRAATAAVKGYGPELLGFLVALHGDAQQAGDVFSQLCEDLWRGLPGFERRSSFRTWAYTLARHALHRFRRGAGRRAGREVPMSQCADVSRVAARVRTQTLSALRTDKRNRLVQLREALPAEDQALLILRVDKNFDWNEIAQVMHEDEKLDDETLKREAARLRKRFQLVKEKLREAAKREGLIASE